MPESKQTDGYIFRAGEELQLYLGRSGESYVKAVSPVSPVQAVPVRRRLADTTGVRDHSSLPGKKRLVVRFDGRRQNTPSAAPIGHFIAIC